MESLLNRYRNITILLLVIFAQLLLLGYQVKTDQDVRMIRVWTVTAVTPVARVVEFFRGGGSGFIRNYITLKDTSAENRRLREELGKLRIENTFLKNELNTADRAKALQLFQARTPSKMLAANIIGTGAGSNSKVVFVNRGSGEGVMRGMAVITPEGIVGKVIAAYPTASEVQLVTDSEFAAGVVTQKTLVRGTLKGQGTPLARVDYVPFEEKVEVGEMFYSSGDDRVFPRGLPVGLVKAVRPGQPFKEILVEPLALQHGIEDVLILIQGVHQDIPVTPPSDQPVYIAPPPPSGTAPAPAADAAPADGTRPASGGTEADRLRSVYKSVGEAQKHTFGEGLPGSKPPDFTKLPNPGQPPAQSAPPAAGKNGPPPAPAPAPAGRGAAPAKPVDPGRRNNQAAGGPGGPGGE